MKTSTKWETEYPMGSAKCGYGSIKAAIAIFVEVW